jgi:hypothetical protein
VAEVRARLEVNKQRSHKFNAERSNLEKLNSVEGKGQYSVEVSDIFAALEDLDAEVHINSVLETERISRCSKLLDQKKQAKLQWLQDLSEMNGINLNNVRHEANRHFSNLRHFRNKKREYLKDKINEILTFYIGGTTTSLMY